MKGSTKPVENGREKEKALAGSLVLLIVGGDASVALDPIEEFFDAMPLSVAERIERSGVFCSSSLGYGSAVSRLAGQRAKRFAIISLFSNDDGLLDLGDNLGSRGNIVDVAGNDDQANGPAKKVNHGVDPGVSPFQLAGSDSLDTSELKGRCSVLANPDVRAIEKAQFPLGSFGHLQEELFEKSHFTEAAEATVNRLPRTRASRQNSPGITAAHDVEDCFQDHPHIRGTLAYAAIRTSRGGATVKFFLPFQALSDMPRGKLGLIRKPSDIPG